MKNEIVVWSCSLCFLLAAYFFIVLGQHIGDPNLAFLFLIFMPLFVILQSIFSKEKQQGLARVVFVSIILGIGLGKLGGGMVLGGSYILIYLLFNFLSNHFKWKFEYMFVYFDRLCTDIGWTKRIWIGIPIVAFIIALAAQPILYEIYSGNPFATLEIRLFSIRPSVIEHSIYMSWVGFFLFSVISVIGWFCSRKEYAKST